MKQLKTTRAKTLPKALVPRADLNEMSRALYKLARAYEAEGPEQDDDAMESWHDSDADNWLRERRAWLEQ